MTTSGDDGTRAQPGRQHQLERVLRLKVCELAREAGSAVELRTLLARAVTMVDEARARDAAVRQAGDGRLIVVVAGILAELRNIVGADGYATLVDRLQADAARLWAAQRPGV